MDVKREVLWQKAGAEGFGGYCGPKWSKACVDPTRLSQSAFYTHRCF